MTSALDVQQILGLRRPPVAIAYLDEPPAGVERWAGPEQPAGCAFWQRAQEGSSFYTLPLDHYGCAVGAYTHAIDLPPGRASQLNDTVGMMVDNGYIEMAEVPGIPRLPKPPRAIAYGPADKAAFEPDVVILAATPSQAMLVYEACLRSGAGNPMVNLTGRPSCAVLPQTVNSGAAATSLGCTGNRLYAGLSDDELYVSIPGGKWQAFKSALEGVLRANEHMRDFYVGNPAYSPSGGS